MFCQLVCEFSTLLLKQGTPLTSDVKVPCSIFLDITPKRQWQRVVYGLCFLDIYIIIIINDTRVNV